MFQAQICDAQAQLAQLREAPRAGGICKNIDALANKRDVAIAKYISEPGDMSAMLELIKSAVAIGLKELQGVRVLIAKAVDTGQVTYNDTQPLVALSRGEIPEEMQEAITVAARLRRADGRRSSGGYVISDLRRVHSKCGQ